MVNHCPMTQATIRLDVQGEVARITFDRPHVLNAGNARFAAELCEAVASIDSRRDVRVVVMTGAGRAFQTGVDLTALAAGELTQPDLIRWEDAMTALERMDKLVIAGINGHCIGGGLQLALVCDYRLAVEDALEEYERPKLDRYKTHLFLAAYSVELDTATGELATHEVAAYA